MKLISYMMLLMMVVSAGDCGKDGSNKKCPAGECCSSYSWCGVSKDHCNSSQQKLFSGPGAPAVSTVSPTNDGKCSASKPCAKGFCCSKYGFCGQGPQYCPTPAPKPAPKPSPVPVPAAGGLKVVSKCTVPGTVALTWDDGAQANQKQIRAKLKAANAKGTFFVNGNNFGCIFDHFKDLQDLVKEGHQLASHTWAHKDLDTIKEPELKSEISKLNNAFTKIIGTTPTFFRPPFGSGQDNKNVLKIVESFGFKYFSLWDLDSGDSTGSTYQQSTAILDKANTKDNHVVLLHEQTQLKLVDYAIAWAQKRKYKMVTMAQCLGATAYNGPVKYLAKNPSDKC